MVTEPGWLFQNPVLSGSRTAGRDLGSPHFQASLEGWGRAWEMCPQGSVAKEV